MDEIDALLLDNVPQSQKCQVLGGPFVMNRADDIEPLVFQYLAPVSQFLQHADFNAESSAVDHFAQVGHHQFGTRRRSNRGLAARSCIWGHVGMVILSINLMSLGFRLRSDCAATCRGFCCIKSDFQPQRTQSAPRQPKAMLKILCDLCVLCGELKLFPRSSRIKAPLRCGSSVPPRTCRGFCCIKSDF